MGGYQKQYQVTVDPHKLRAYGVTLQDVIGAIRASNNDVGGRILEMAGREYYIRGRGYIQDLATIEKIALRASGPAGTPLADTGRGPACRFGPEIRRGLLEWNGEGEAVGGDRGHALRGERPGGDRAGQAASIAELRPSFPEGVELKIAYDRSGLIERSIDTLKTALIEEAVVVSLVIVLFLLHLRSSLLPILSLPIAVALSFIPMYLLDIPSTIMSLGGIAIAIGATVDAEIVMIEASHKKLEHAPPGADRHALLAEAAREVTPAIFFSLLIIAVAFLPVFTLTGQAGRLFQPLACTKTFVMLISAVLSITFAPALRDVLIRGNIRPEHKHPVSRFIVRLYEPFVYVALRNPKSTVAIGALAVLSAIPIAGKLGHEFMPPLNEGDILYMPITFPNISIEEAKRQLQIQDRLLRQFPEVESVFGKIGRAESATDPAPLSMVETTVRLKPAEQWREKHHPRWYSNWAPDWLQRVLRPIWPEHQRMTWDELTAEMNAEMQLPGWTNAWTLPIKTRIDMLTTGVRTPIGIKVFGTDLQEIERVGTAAGASDRPHRRHPQRALRAQPGRPVRRHHPPAGRPGPLRPARGRHPGGDRERHRRHTDRHHHRGAQPLQHQRSLPPGPAQRPREAAPGAGAVDPRGRAEPHAHGHPGQPAPAGRRHRHRARPGDARHGHLAGGRREPGGHPAAAAGDAHLRRADGPGRGHAHDADAPGGARDNAARRGSRRSPTAVGRDRTSSRWDSWPTSASPAARPWSGTRPGCWSATSTSTSIRASATSAATSTRPRRWWAPPWPRAS